MTEPNRRPAIKVVFTDEATELERALVRDIVESLPSVAAVHDSTHVDQLPTR